jgi:hypothetical protein
MIESAAKQTMTTQLLQFKARDPRLNLPPESGRKRAEANFVIKFMDAYLKQIAPAGVGGKHFAMPGFGIADFVWIAWRNVSGGDEGAALSLERLKVRLMKHRLTAFEMKLTDWRKGLAQAYRYGHFSDRAVLVVPPNIAKTAIENKCLFEHLNVGLWSFDPTTEKIRKHVNPKTWGARSAGARAKAVELICRRVNFGKTRK